MGQPARPERAQRVEGALDLPDPLNTSGPASAGVDDLLAQLAGEEIDRLLAEADVERPKTAAVEVILPPPVLSAAARPQPPVATGTVSNIALASSNAGLAPSAADPPQSQIHIDPEPILPPAPMAEADVEELDARVAQELNSLFTELDSPKPASPPPQKAPYPTPSPAPPPAPAAPSAPPIEVTAVLAPISPPLPSDPVAQAQQLEKQLLEKTLLDALGPSEPQSIAGLKSINFSLLLRPLEWLNAPLAACSDAFRETLGKVAIMTLINALAILLYVLFLRKH